jgi:hypothetical protein
MIEVSNFQIPKRQRSRTALSEFQKNDIQSPFQAVHEVLATLIFASYHFLNLACRRRPSIRKNFELDISSCQDKKADHLENAGQFKR